MDPHDALRIELLKDSYDVLKMVTSAIKDKDLGQIKKFTQANEDLQVVLEDTDTDSQKGNEDSDKDKKTEEKKHSEKATSEKKNMTEVKQSKVVEKNEAEVKQAKVVEKNEAEAKQTKVVEKNETEVKQTKVVEKPIDKTENNAKEKVDKTQPATLEMKHVKEEQKSDKVKFLKIKEESKNDQLETKKKPDLNEIEKPKIFRKIPRPQTKENSKIETLVKPKAVS